jgi:hypothetical protein
VNRAWHRFGLLPLLLALSASAFILPPASILRRMTEARDELQVSNLRLDGMLTFANSSARSAGAALGGAGRSELQVDALLLMKLPGRCRLEATTPEGSRSVAIWSHGKERTEGARLDELAAVLSQICPFLAARSSTDAETRAAIDRHLRALKVDVRTATLGRLGSQVAYVLGAAAEGQPQFWIYKDTFLPARVRWADPDKKLSDIRFLDYGSPISGESFPRVVELYRDGELLLRFAGLKSDTRSALADKLF